jgi:hypothetical protein
MQSMALRRTELDPLLGSITITLIMYALMLHLFVGTQGSNKDLDHRINRLIKDVYYMK